MDLFCPGSASLVDLVDRHILVVLRDGRHLLGYLRTYDQFGNIVLHESVERIYTQDKRVATVQRGLFLIRGENVALLGDSDPIKDEQLLSSLELVSEKEALSSKSEHELERIRLTRIQAKTLALKKGFCVDVTGIKSEVFRTM